MMEVTSLLTYSTIALLLALLAFTYIGYTVIYRLYSHPLSIYPGPRTWAISRIPFHVYTLRGRSAHKLIALHDRYGPVVRYAPNALSYIGPDSWDEIYGPYTGKKHMEMDPALFGGNITVTGALQITNAIGDDHKRLRKRFMRGLSSKAVVEQEETLQTFVSSFVRGIRSEASETESAIVDVAKWFSLATFDVIGDMAFGKSFDGLATGKYHSWVGVVFGAFKALPFLRIVREIPGVTALGGHAALFLPTTLKKMWYDHFDYAFSLMEQRFEKPQERRDIIYYIFEGGDNDLTRNEIRESAAQLVMAGSEPTATFMTGLIYYLGVNPKVHKRLNDEIRSCYSINEESTASILATLPYFDAVIKEGLRIFPPAPDLFPRIIPDGGEHIMGKYLPAGVHVSVAALAASHSSANFDAPQRFWPERWSIHKDDPRLRASYPFGQGHRSCLGKSLAYAEIRLFVANFLNIFDFELLDEDHDWIDRCRVFLGWEKPALRVRIKECLRVGQI